MEQPGSFQQYGQPSQPPQQSYQNPQKPPRKKLWLIMGSIGAVIGVAALALLLLSVFGDREKAADGTDTQPEPATAVERLVLDARTALTPPSSNPASGYLSVEGDFSQAPVFARPALLSNDESFAVFPTVTHGFQASYPSLADATTAAANLGNELTDAGLSETDTLAVAGDSYTRYGSSEFTCTVYQLREPEETSIENPYPISLGCAANADYDASFATAQPYATVIADVDDPTIADFDAPIIDTIIVRDGANAAAQNAEVLVRAYPFGQTGVPVLTYRTDESTPWLFFATALNTPACTAFDSPELQTAFSGVSCIDAQGEVSTVQSNE